MQHVQGGAGNGFGADWEGGAPLPHSHLYSGTHLSEHSSSANQRSPLLDCEVLEGRHGVLFISRGPALHPVSIITTITTVNGY